MDSGSQKMVGWLFSLVVILAPFALLTELITRSPFIALGFLFVSVSYILYCLIPFIARSVEIGTITIFCWQISGLVIIYGLHGLPHEKISFLYTKLWINRIELATVPSVIIAGLLFYFYQRSSKSTLKHGPEFSSPTLNDDTIPGITIGRIDRNVLPEITRQFCNVNELPVILAYDRLSRGITALGEMGMGKSRLLAAIEAGIRKQYPDIPILIHDPKGEWLRTCYNPETDLIFAPNDERSCGWKIWEDFKLHPELRHSLITSAVESHHSGQSDRFWSDTAIQLLKTAVSKPDVETAKKFLKLKKDENAGDKTFQSTYATAALSFRDIATIDYIAKKGPAKTIDEFLQHKGRIFLLNNPACATEQHGALSLMLSAFLIQAVSQPDLPEPQLRAAVIIDEALTFHLPADVERVVYNQSRSKGLCIVAAAQRLPDSTYGERGMWANQAYHYFAMRISDLRTREALAQRTGKLIFNEEQKSNSESKGIDGNGNTSTSEVERHYSAMSPESFGALSPREFILFHNAGIAPGIVANVPGEQRDDIKTIQYTPQDAALEFLADI